MGIQNPREKKRRIAGEGSSLAKEFPEVARLFEVSGPDQRPSQFQTKRDHKGL